MCIYIKNFLHHTVWSYRRRGVSPSFRREGRRRSLVDRQRSASVVLFCSVWLHVCQLPFTYRWRRGCCHPTAARHAVCERSYSYCDAWSRRPTCDHHGFMVQSPQGDLRAINTQECRTGHFLRSTINRFFRLHTIVQAYRYWFACLIPG